MVGHISSYNFNNNNNNNDVTLIIMQLDIYTALFTNIMKTVFAP